MSGWASRNHFFDDYEDDTEPPATNARWTDERIEAALKASGQRVKNLTPRVTAVIDEAQRRERLKVRVLSVAGVVMFGVFLLVTLAGCGGSGGGIRATAEALGTRFPTVAAEATQPATATPSPLPTAQPTVQPATLEATVEATADVAGFEELAKAIVACDGRTPRPTVQLDATDEAAGVVLRSTWCQ